MNAITRGRLREVSRRIMENDPELAEVARSLGSDEELRKTVDKIRPDLLQTSPHEFEAMDAGIDDFVVETIVQRVGRPVLLVRNNSYELTDERLNAPDAGIWKKRLFDPVTKSKLESRIPLIGRVNLVNNLDYDWVGTAWVAAPDLVVTNRHVAKVFTEVRGGRLEFRPGYPGAKMEAAIDFLEEHENQQTHIFRVVDILYLAGDDEPDIAILKVEKRNGTGAELKESIRFAASPPRLKQFVAAIGYPAYDSRIPDADLIEKFFGDIFNKKRLAPGQIIDNADGLLSHDCSTSGGNSGSPVIDLESGEMLGLHFSGQFLRQNLAVPARVVSDLLDRVNGGTSVPVGAIPQLPTVVNVTAETSRQTSTGGGFTIPLQIRVSVEVPDQVREQTVTLPAQSNSEFAEQQFAAKQDLTRPITYQEFMEMVDSPDVPLEQLAPYFIQDESLSSRLDPGFRLHPGKVMIDPEEVFAESAQLLNTANWIYKKKRQQRYIKQIRDGTQRIRIVAEGDSWFQYPVMLHDVIDHLMDRPELGIFCCSEAGDVISSMLPKGEFYVAIQREEAKVFLFSGGGNDLVDGAGLRRFLRNLPVGSPVKDHFNTTYRSFMANISKQYETLFARVTKHRPEIHIICHGYSYAIPQPGKGKWLGKPMSEIGISDFNQQRAIVRKIVDDLNEALADTASKFSNATYVDLRDTVPVNGWHDEFHPTSDWFGRVAAPIYQEILKHR